MTDAYKAKRAAKQAKQRNRETVQKFNIQGFLALEAEMLAKPGVTAIAVFFTPESPVVVELTTGETEQPMEALIRFAETGRKAYAGLEYDIVWAVRLSDGWTKSKACRVRGVYDGIPEDPKRFPYFGGFLEQASN